MRTTTGTLIGSKKKNVQRALACALTLFCLSSYAAAAPNAEQIAAYSAAPENERVQLLVFLAKSGASEDARYLMKTYPLQGAFAANRLLFIDGLILKAERDYTGAAEKFRTALADDPSLTLVRAELAQTLIILEQDDSAKYHLKQLAADAPSEEAAKGVHSFLEQVDSRRPYTVSGYLSLAPSTNLNNGSKRQTVYNAVYKSDSTIDAASREKSGVGASAGANVGFNKRFGNDFSFVAAGGVNANIYDDFDFNFYNVSQSAEMRRLVEKGYFSLGAVASQSFYDGVATVSYGPRVSTSLQLTGKDNLFVSALYEWRDNFEVNSADATALSVNASLTHGFSSTLSATIFAGSEDVKTDYKTTSYLRLNGGLSLYSELSHGISAKLTGQFGHTLFDGKSLAAGKIREDKRLTGSVELTKRDWNILGFAPALSYTYTENISNLNLYDFDNHAVDFRLTKDF